MKKFAPYFLRLGLIFLSVLPISSVLAQSWRTYPYAPPGSPIRFPQDEGSHPGSKTEWWYFNFHLKEKNSGRHIAAMVTYFNNQIKLLNLTDETSGRFFPHSQLGKLVSRTGFLQLTHSAIQNPYPDRFFVLQTGGQLKPFQYFLDAYAQGTHLRLFLKAEKPPLLITGDGVLPVGSAGTTFYYSLPLLSVSGECTAEGATDSVKGIGWMDHQWGPFFVTPISEESYEWFSVQLEDNRQIVFWDIFNKDRQIPADEAHKMCTLSLANSTQDTSLGFTVRRLRFWTSPQGVTFSHAWEFCDPVHHVDLRIQPTVDNQVADVLGTMPFYEGSCSVSGIWNGDSVRGVAFAELLHRYQTPKVHINWPPQGDFPAGQFRVTWQVENPDAGRPLFFDLFLCNDSTHVEYPLAHQWKDTSFVFTQRRFPAGLSYRFKLVAYSWDSTLVGQALSPSFPLFYLGRRTVEVLAPYPNPFRADVSILVFIRRDSIQKACPITLEISDVLGRQVWKKQAVMVPNKIVPFRWHGASFDGKALPAGVYFATIQIAGQRMTRKLLKLP